MGKSNPSNVCRTKALLESFIFLEFFGFKIVDEFFLALAGEDVLPIHTTPMQVKFVDSGEKVMVATFVIEAVEHPAVHKHRLYGFVRTTAIFGVKPFDFILFHFLSCLLLQR